METYQIFCVNKTKKGDATLARGISFRCMTQLS